MEERFEKFWDEDRIRIYSSAMEQVIHEIELWDEKYYKKTGNKMIRFVEKRLKKPDSIEQKLIRKKKQFEQKPLEELLNDLAGVRVICFDTNQIYKLVKWIKTSTGFEVIKEKDYVSRPKENGYQSYHIILKVKQVPENEYIEQDVKVEIQIRTILMDAWSSMESILVYKKNKDISENVQANIKNYAKWSRKMDKMVSRMLEKPEIGEMAVSNF